MLGREVDVDLLAATAGRDVDELLDALEAAVLAGLLDEPAPGRVRFTHALVRDTLYEDTPLLRRTRLHAAALTALQVAGGADALTLAHHAVAAATRTTAAQAVPLVVAAAREVEALGAYGDAARLWTTALRTAELAGGPADPALLLPALSAAARAGDIVTARALQRTAVELAAGDRDGVVAALACWDAPLVWSVRDDGAQDPLLLDPLRELLETPAGDDLPDDVRCRLLVALVRETEGVDDERARDASAQALLLARRRPDDRRLLLCRAERPRLLRARTRPRGRARRPRGRVRRRGGRTGRPPARRPLAAVPRRGGPHRPRRGPPARRHRRGPRRQRPAGPPARSPAPARRRAARARRPDGRGPGALRGRRGAAGGGGRHERRAHGDDRPLRRGLRAR